MKGRRSFWRFCLRLGFIHVGDLRSTADLLDVRKVCGHRQKSPPPTPPQGQYAKIIVQDGPGRAAGAVGSRKSPKNPV